MWRTAWETTARYVWSKKRFELTLPMISGYKPFNMNIKYDDHTNSIKICGQLQQNVKSNIYAHTAVFNTPKYHETILDLHHQRLLEKNAQSELHISECCPKK